MKVKEKIHISIVIDEENTTNLEVSPDEDVNNLVLKLSEKYKIKDNVQIKLKNYIEHFIKVTNEKTKQQLLEKKNMLASSVERLYYKAKDKIKKKEDIIKKIKDEEFNAFISECSFKPKINFNSQKLQDKKNIKIEEKLQMAGQSYKEKTQIKRIINEVNSRNEQDKNIQRSKSLNQLKTSIKNKDKESKITINSAITSTPKVEMIDLRRFSFSSNNYSIIDNPKISYQTPIKPSLITLTKNELNPNVALTESPLNKVCFSPHNLSKQDNQKSKSQQFNFNYEDCNPKANMNYTVKTNYFNQNNYENFSKTLEKPKVTKTNVHEKLYSKGIEMQEKQKERYELIKRNEYTFSPEINSKSKIMREKVKETKDDFVKRLNNPPKRVNKDFIYKESYENIDSKMKSDKFNEEKKSTIEFSSEKSSYSSKYKSASKQKYYISNEKIPDNHHTPSLLKNLENEKKKEEKLKTTVQTKVNQNLNNFKLNNLKEIFEIVYKNCSKIDDLDNIDIYGISAHIKEKLIIPTCQIMQKRNLEFNFQNFYLIANEIMNFLLNN